MSDRLPTLRVVPMRADINTNGHIFGGWVLAQMDIAGGILAFAEAGGPVATVAIERMSFTAPILVGDLVSVFTRVERRGRTSVAIAIEVVATRNGRGVPVTDGIFTFVAIDEDGRPRLLSGTSL